jgi:hypothetical protein
MTARAEIGGARSVRGWRIAVWGGAALLLLAPAVATRLSDEMQWDAGDFILVGAMLLGGCGLWELAIRKSGSRAYGAGAGIAAAAAFLLFLVNGAVGLIGNEDQPVNLIYLGVIAVGLAGAVVGRFRPQGMARAMAVTAGAQMLAGAVAVTLVPDLRGFLLGTALFTPLWLLAAWLFGKAARN